MAYIGNSMSDSMTVNGRAASALTDKGGYAVKFNNSGKIAVCTSAGEAALGLLPMQGGTCLSGEEVSVQVSGIGLWKSGAAISAGALLACDAAGCCRAATAGQFMLGVALESASAAGKLIRVQITKSGFVESANE